MHPLLATAIVHAPRQLDPLLDLGRRYVMPALRPKLPAAVLAGRTAAGERCRILVVDPRLTAWRLVRLVLATEPETLWSGEVALTGLRRFIAAERERVDLVLATVPRALPRFLRPAHRLHMPGLVEARLPVAVDREAQLRRVGGKRRNRLRRAERAGLTWRVGDTGAEIRRFIEQHHRPFVTSRFGADSVLQERPILERLGRRGGVLWLLHDGREIAGDLFSRKGDLLWLMVTGVVGDPPATIPTTQEALPLFATDLARQLGCGMLSFGAVAPVLRDGLLQFKLSFGVELVDYAQSHRELLIDWARPSPALRTLLRDYPLVVRSGHGLAAVTSVAGSDPDADRAAPRTTLPPGIDRLLALDEAGTIVALDPATA